MKLQFRQRTLMIVVTLWAVPLGYVGWQAKIVRERKATLNRLKSRGGIYLTVGQYRLLPARHKLAEDRFPTVSWLRTWCGDEAVLGFYIPPSVSAQKAQAIIDQFPDAIVDRGPATQP